MKQNTRLLIVALITLGTLSIHYYDIIFAGVLGHSHLMHAIHGRLCYIPIVLAAFWFGVRGGLTTALVISIFTLVYIYISPASQPMETYGEFTEIAFYFAIGGFSGSSSTPSAPAATSARRPSESSSRPSGSRLWARW